MAARLSIALRSLRPWERVPTPLTASAPAPRPSMLRFWTSLMTPAVSVITPLQDDGKANMIVSPGLALATSGPNLKGKSILDRARAMISSVNPDFRALVVLLLLRGLSVGKVGRSQRIEQHAMSPPNRPESSASAGTLRLCRRPDGRSRSARPAAVPAAVIERATSHPHQPWSRTARSGPASWRETRCIGATWHS